MTEILQITFKVSLLVFIVSSMMSMGLGLTIRQIAEPLKNVKLVVVSLVVNFLLVPLLVYGIIIIVPLNEGERIAMLLISIAGGAPFIPKLAEMAKGDIPFSLALMLLLMVITIFFMPLVVPVMLKGAEVSSWTIAKSLVVTMLLPLIVALILKAYWEKGAQPLREFFAKLTNIAMLLLLISLVILNTNYLIDMIGYPLLAILLLLGGAMAMGYYLGGKKKEMRVVSALGAGQRNISAALLVGTQNFDNPDITIMLVAVSIFGLFIMVPYARKMAKAMH